LRKSDDKPTKSYEAPSAPCNHLVGRQPSVACKRTKRRHLTGGLPGEADCAAVQSQLLAGKRLRMRSVSRVSDELNAAL